MNKYIDDLGTWVLTRGDENEKHSTEEGSVVEFSWRHQCELTLHTHTHAYIL